MTYEKLVKFFEEKLKRDLKDEEITFIKWMVENEKQKSSI
jgi:hypothetical protein